MVEIKTEAKVTKLTKSPSRYYVFNERKKVDTTKSEGELKKPATPTKDIASEKAQSLCIKCESFKDTTVKAVRDIFKNGRNAIIRAVSGLKSAKRQRTYDNSLKYAIVGVLAVICAAICVSTCSLGYKVTVGDVSLGVISSKSIYNEVFNNVSEDVFTLTGKEFELSGKPEFSLTIIPDRNILSRSEFTEKLKSLSNMMIPAYTIVIDGEMVVSLPTEEMAKTAVEEYKESFFDEDMDSEVKFTSDVKISYMFAPKDILYTKDAAVTYLLNGEFSYYRADKEQTVKEVSEKMRISENTILSANEISDDKIKKGQVLKLYSGRMFADVIAMEYVQREVSIPYETVQKDSGELYQGTTKIETVGKEGLKEVEECVTYINGKETKRDILVENILKTPTVQVELVGVKEPPPSVGTGNLIVPTNGTLSSRYGCRWGRKHEGVDLSAPEGTPIYAADNGTVTYAEFNNGGYGYMVKIDHGNGLETCYAHCSELLVEVGQVVSKDDLIAKVGNTGRSTGAHLHFEVRQEGIAIDPMRFLD